LKKYLALIAAIFVAILVGAVLFFGKTYKHDDRPIISDIKKHNEMMAGCMKTALSKHPGAIVEIEMEKEDGHLYLILIFKTPMASIGRLNAMLKLVK